MQQLAQSDLASLAEELELRNLAFDGLSLIGFDFADRVIEDCSFRDCVLTDARFNTTALRACEFAGARVQGVSFFAARIDECKMMGLDFGRGARFDAAMFSQTNLDYSSFRNADLTGVEFRGCSMREVDLSGADLSNATLIECDLSDVDWARVTTRGTDLSGSRIRGLDLRTGPYDVIITSRQAVGLVEDLGVRVFDPAD